MNPIAQMQQAPMQQAPMQQAPQPQQAPPEPAVSKAIRAQPAPVKAAIVKVLQAAQEKIGHENGVQAVAMRIQQEGDPIYSLGQTIGNITRAAIKSAKVKLPNSAIAMTLTMIGEIILAVVAQAGLVPQDVLKKNARQILAVAAHVLKDGPKAVQPDEPQGQPPATQGQAPMQPPGGIVQGMMG